MVDRLNHYTKQWRKATLRVRFLASQIGKTSIIVPAAFLSAAGIGVAALGLLFYVRDELSATPAITSLFAATWTLTYSIGCLTLRRLASRFLPRISLLIATTSMAVFICLIPVFASLPSAFILYAVYGLMISFFWPPAMGWLSAGFEDAALNKKISYFNMSWSAGTVLSPFLGGLFYEAGPIVPILAASAFFTAAALLIGIASLVLPKIKKDTHKEPLSSAAGSAEDKSTRLRIPSWISLTSGYLFFGIIINVFPLFARDGLAMAESKVGLLLLARSLSTSLMFLLLGRMSFWHFNRMWLIGTPIAVAIAGAALALPVGKIGYFILLFIFGIVLSITYNNSVFHGISGSTQRAKRMAIHEALLTAGVVFGSVIGGYLYERYSISLVFGSAAAVALLSCIPVAILVFNKKTT